jgi:hypothetical protein
MEERQGYEAIVGSVTFDEHGQNISPAITKYVVQDGKWVPWQNSEYATGKRKLKRIVSITNLGGGAETVPPHQ